MFPFVLCYVAIRYLSSRFFQMLHDSPAEFRRNLLFVVAFVPRKEGQSQGQGPDQGQDQGKDGDDVYSLGLGRVVAGTINLVKGTHFYGRYWGCFAFVKHLHFEACYYKAIEYCIENGLTYMEVGSRWLLFVILVYGSRCCHSTLSHLLSPLYSQEGRTR